MKDFKDSTKVQYMKGGSCDGYAKGGKVKGAAKISKVMGEFKRGELHSGSKEGPKVTSQKQATAIALSEARKAGAKIPVKRAEGTPMGKGPERRPTIEDLNRANRDVGGMSKAAVDAAGRAIARGNRVSVEEGRESSLVSRKTSRKAREVAVENTREYSRAEPAEPRTALDRKLSTLPSQRGEMAHPRGKGSFRSIPLVGAAMDAMGFKKGGLSVMPRSKK